MNIEKINGVDYRLPGGLNPFQRDMYVHLINQKWKLGINEPGEYKFKGQVIKYDAILPKALSKDLRVVYRPIFEELRRHSKVLHFRQHVHFNHMASSQAANVNLFLPVLGSSKVNEILGSIKPDFGQLAAKQLDNGYRIEFWDEWNSPLGKLGDKTLWSGTDSDIGIAYYNKDGELCLWLIEHKLTESEFTTCGGARSKKNVKKENCAKSYSEILKNKSACYYHSVRDFRYWDITEANRTFFTNGDRHAICPFKGGMNQLWRNQLLALSIEQDRTQPYKHVFFSVVKHPRNEQLDGTLKAYKELIADHPKFTVLTSADVLIAANRFADKDLTKWVNWYKDFYAV